MSGDANWTSVFLILACLYPDNRTIGVVESCNASAVLIGFTRLVATQAPAAIGAKRTASPVLDVKRAFADPAITLGHFGII